MRQGRAEEDIGKNCQAEKRSDKPDWGMLQPPQDYKEGRLQGREKKMTISVTANLIHE